MAVRERPLVIVKDTREPDVAAGDHPSAVFVPRIHPAGLPRDMPYADRPRAPVPVVRSALDVGDYSLPGLEQLVSIERKSGPDLLQTLFGGTTDALGEGQANQDRFRAELERARDHALFAIVVETDEAGLFREAQRRFDRYGKSFDPERVIAIMRGFAVDLGVPTIWCSPIVVAIEDACPLCEGAAVWAPPGTAMTVRCPCCSGSAMVRSQRLLMTGKERAELEIGGTLARVWSQATGGQKARDAKKRGYRLPWLDVLAEAPLEVPSAEPSGVVPFAPKLAPAGGMVASSSEAARLRAGKRRRAG